jgi:hypothetical protein
MNKESKAADDAAFASHIERQRKRIDAAIAGALAFLFVLAGVAALAAAVCGL